MKKSIFPFFLAGLLTLSCSSQQEKTTATDTDIDTLSQVLNGDSTLYGLACDGSNDTIVVFLPIDNIAADPDTLNILNASRRHHVFGKLKTGDRIAVVRSATDSTAADYVISIDNLKATWCYKVLPTLHVRADMAGHSEKQILSNLPDSVRELLNIPHEYSIQLKGDHTVTAIGNHHKNREETDQLVDYPLPKRYGQWQLFNGKLLLTEVGMDSVGNTFAVSTDTAEFVLMDRDTLVLRFNDGVKNYYPRRNTNMQE